MYVYKCYNVTAFNRIRARCRYQNVIGLTKNVSRIADNDYLYLVMTKEKLKFSQKDGVELCKIETIQPAE